MGVSSGFSWAGFSLERFVIGKASHGKGLPMGKAFPWEGLPMGKAFPWEGLLIGKVSQGQGFYASDGLVLIPCVVPHDMGVSSGFSWAGFSLERFVIGKAFPWEGLLIGEVSQGQGFYASDGLLPIPCVVPHDMGVSSGFSWAGFSLESFVIGKAFPWQGLPMGWPSHGQAFPWEAFPMT